MKVYFFIFENLLVIIIVFINRDNGKSIYGEDKDLNKEDQNRKQRTVENAKPSNSLPGYDFQHIISNIECCDKRNMPAESALQEFTRAREKENRT